MTREELKEYELTEVEKSKIIALISALFPKAKIYLFGSRATGKFSRGSDVDIALDNDSEIDYYELAELRNILNDLSMVYKVDLIDLNSRLVSESFKKYISAEMIPWKC